MIPPRTGHRRRGSPTNRTSCFVTRMRSPTASGKSRGSHGPAANTNSAAARRRPSPSVTSRSRRPSTAPGSAHPSSLRPPSSSNVRATAATPRRAISRPASGSKIANARSSERICGQRAATSSGESRSTGMSRLRSVASEDASQPPSSWASHRTPAGTNRRSPIASARAFQAGQRLARPAAVERVVAVRCADDPRLVARRCPRIAGPEGIDERRPPALASGPEGDPGAHHAGPDDDEISRVPARPARPDGHGVSVSVEAAAAATAAGVNGSGTVSPSIHGPIWSL